MEAFGPGDGDFWPRAIHPHQTFSPHSVAVEKKHMAARSHLGSAEENG